MDWIKVKSHAFAGAVWAATAVSAFATQLSSGARTAIPHNVRQLIVIDYNNAEFHGCGQSPQSLDAAPTQAF